MTDLAKARGDRARIEALIARQSASVRRAFRQFLDKMQDGPARAAVRRALERGDIEAALRVADTYIAPLGGAVQRVFTAAADAEVAALAPAVARSIGRRAAVALDFDPASPRAADIMRRNRLQFVEGFTGAQREATRAALEGALRSGAGPIQAARAFRDSIGLTEVQRRAVETYRGLLEAGDKAALDRALRDRRNDAAVARAADEGEPLGAARVIRMVDRYRARLIQSRAETIARTETMRSVALARQEALAQTLEQVGMPRGAVVRVWRATQDARTRDSHLAMDEQRRGMDVPFDSPSGAQLMYPGDPSAPADEVINCRCVVLHEFEEGAAEE